MTLIISLALSILTTLLLTAFIKFKHWIDWIIVLYSITFSETILIFEFLGLFSAITNVSLFLIIQVILLVVSFVIWRKREKPDPFQNIRALLKDFFEFWGQKAKHPALIFFLIGSIFFMLVNAWLIISVPPNTSDSLSTHLARVIHWIQNGSFRPWDAKIPWQVVYPFNAQLIYLKIILFSSSDKLVGFVQFFASLVSFLAVYRLGLFFSSSKARALFAACIWMTFPEIIMQTTSTQNDLVLASFFVSSILFLFQGIKDRSDLYLVLSGISLGLALGTKQTVLFLLPGMSLAIVFIIMKFNKPVIKQLIKWGLASLVSFFFLGSYIYIQNTIHFHSPAGPSKVVEGQMNEFSLQNMSQELPINIFRLIYQSIDPSGLPGELPGYMQKFKAKLVEYAGLKEWVESDIGAVKVFNLRDLPSTHEDSAWYGLTSVLLLFPAIVGQSIYGIKKRNPYLIGMIAISIGFLIFDALLRPGWAPYQGRYFVTATTVAAPLITRFDLDSKWGKIATWFFTLLALIIGSTMILKNESKAIIGSRTIWGKDRIEMQLVNSPRSSAGILGFADKYLPEGITFGVRKLPLFYEYVLIGNNRDRRIIWLPNNSEVYDQQLLREKGVEFILLNDADFPPKNMPDWLIPYEARRGWTIYVFK